MNYQRLQSADIEMIILALGLDCPATAHGFDCCCTYYIFERGQQQGGCMPSSVHQSQGVFTNEHLLKGAAIKKRGMWSFQFYE